METPIERFARVILERPLYPYQAEVANAIIHSIDNNLGWIITVMMSRQSGKNQVSAVLEAYLLFNHGEGGTIIKAAPTFNPQIINSRRRLLQMFSRSFLRPRIWTSYGMVGLAPSPDREAQRLHIGPAVSFFSADPESNVVGATADILLEVDEAQDIDPEKFDRDFRPMASTSNATTVMYGTAWSDETLLARQRAINLEIQERTGEQRHFEVDWREVAKVNKNYKKFVEAEMQRLGEDHIAIQTQYFLKAISGAGYFLNDLQRLLIQGEHQWETEPQDGIYLASVDVGGEERPDPEEPTKPPGKRDSTVVTIGRASYNDLNLPVIEVVHHQWWTGMHVVDQYAAINQLVEHFDLRHVVVDATGEGAGLASLLIEKHGQERITAFKFTRPSKSKIGYALLAMVNSGRLKVYSKDGAPRDIYEELWGQIKRTRYRLPAAEIIDFYVDPSEGHDDFVISLALLTEALEGMTAPAASDFVKPKRLYEGEGRF